MNQTVADRPSLTVIRPARRDDCAEIAELFLISSDGLAEYIWSRTAAQSASLIEIGRRRYEREGVDFSYQNCLMAQRAGEVLGMVHSYPMLLRDAAVDQEDEEEIDPVLQPAAELEDPGSLYVSGVAIYPDHRGHGLGTRLLEAAHARAADLGLPRVSLICFDRNEGAMRLYRRLGYVEIDRRPIVPHPTLHYRDGDAVLLARPVDGMGRSRKRD